MEKSVILTFLFAINTLLQCANSAPGESQGKLELPNLKLGKDILISFKNIFNGDTQEKDVKNLHQKIGNYDYQRNLQTLASQFITPLAIQHEEVESLEENFQAMLELMEQLNRDYGQYQVYQQLNKSASDPRVRSFAQDAIRPYRNPSARMDGVYALLFPDPRYTQDNYIVPQIINQLKGYNIFCDQFESQQQLLQTVLTGIGVTEFKVFLLTEYSYRKLSEIKEVNYNTEMSKVRSKFNERFKRLISEFEKYMPKASREVWACSPEEYKEDKNYFRMNAFQSYVVRDSEFKNDEYFSCAGGCNNYNNVRQTRCSNKDVYWDSDPGFEYYQYSICATTPRRCNGKLYHCRDRFDAYSQLWICPSDENSTRRYEYMVHGKVGFFGGSDFRRYGDPNNNKVCKRKYSYDYRSYDGSFKICEVCLCTCQETDSPTSDQKINIRPILADKDHVITGIRWTKKKHALTLQIEQGKFSKGKVDGHTVHWKDTADPRNDSDVRFFNWENFRGFYLKNVEVPKGKFLVGVRLIDMQVGSMKLVVPQLLSASYDEESGKLRHQIPFYNFPDKSAEYSDVWVPSPSTIKEQNILPRHEIYFEEGRVPTDFADEAVVVDSGAYVLLTTSDFRTDLGQNTVPYFEKGNIVAEPPVPLSGLGIYFKQNNEKSGGFLALKGLTMDESAYVKQEV